MQCVDRKRDGWMDGKQYITIHPSEDMCMKMISSLCHYHVCKLNFALPFDKREKMYYKYNNNALLFLTEP